MWVGGQRYAPANLPPKKRPGTHCTRGWVGHRPGLEGCEKSRSQGLDPRTVQDVASSYADYAVPTHSFLSINIRSKCLSKHFISLSVRDHLSKPCIAEQIGAPTLLSGNFSVQHRTCIIDYRGAHYIQFAFQWNYSYRITKLSAEIHFIHRINNLNNRDT